MYVGNFYEILSLVKSYHFYCPEVSLQVKALWIVIYAMLPIDRY